MKYLLLVIILTIQLNLFGQEHSDFSTAYIICDLSGFRIDSLYGTGLNDDEAFDTCLGTFGDSEQQSTWFKWTCSEQGTLVFTADPLQDYDDLDFVLFQLNEGIDNFINREVVRCNAAYGGLDLNTGEVTSCTDLTGLNFESEDLEEDSGCDVGEDGFLKFLEMNEGESYALCINNWSITGIGFTLKFDGTASLLNENCSEITSSIEESSLLYPHISLYPNPVSEITILAFPQYNEMSSPAFTLYDMYGIQMIDKQITSEKTLVDLTNLIGGVYLIKVRDEDRTVFNELIIKR